MNKVAAPVGRSRTREGRIYLVMMMMMMLPLQRKKAATSEMEAPSPDRSSSLVYFVMYQSYSYKLLVVFWWSGGTVLVCKHHLVMSVCWICLFMSCYGSVE